jgi:hypothetical protein
VEKHDDRQIALQTQLSEPYPRRSPENAMTDQIKPKNCGGRPRLPAPPVDTVSTRAVISAESAKTNPSERRIRLWYRLLRAFTAAEDAAREDRRVTALESSARSKSELASIKRQEYLRRFATTPHGAKALLTQIETLKARVRTLEASGIEVAVESSRG